MPSRSRRPRPTAHDVAAEIIHRATAANGKPTGGYVIRLSNSPTRGERLQLLAPRLERRPIVIMPHKCASVEEWMARYASMKNC